MSDSAVVGSDWSAGETISVATQFQAIGGDVWIATGNEAPAKAMAGNRVPDGRAVNIDGGNTVYWRSDSTVSPVYISWLTVGD